jgi:hypothetical protein
MGFTPWPADLTAEGVMMARNFAERHGDIISLMLIGGIPWPEARDGRPFSPDIQNTLRYRPPAGTKLFLSIAPLNRDRSGLAPYWGKKDNLPLPEPWNHQAFDSPEVRTAFLNFALRAIEAMHPDYLAIGVENNVLLSKQPEKWNQLKELHGATYQGIKAKYPELPVCFTTEIIHYKKLVSEAKDKDQVREVAEMMRYSDLFAMSFYPYMSYETPHPVPADFLDFARSFRKPITISESGMTSRNVELKSFHITLHGSDADQSQFTEFLLKTAARDRYAFVINFATTDFEKLIAKLPPPTDDIARIWAYTGMQTGDGKPKPALSVWDAYRSLPYRR